MSEKETGVKTNGQVTRETMASGNAGTRRRNPRPRVHSVAGIQVRAELRAKHYQPQVKDRFSAGYHKPGSLNPRKVGR